MNRSNGVHHRPMPVRPGRWGAKHGRRVRDIAATNRSAAPASRPRLSDKSRHWRDAGRGDLPIVLGHDHNAKRLDTTTTPAKIGSNFGCHRAGRCLLLQALHHGIRPPSAQHSLDLALIKAFVRDHHQRHAVTKPLALVAGVVGWHLIGYGDDYRQVCGLLVVIAADARRLVSFPNRMLILQAAACVALGWSGAHPVNSGLGVRARHDHAA